MQVYFQGLKNIRLLPNRNVLLFLLFFLPALSGSTAFAAGKQALVLAAFGSAEPAAISSIEAFAENLRGERPDLKIVKAFTSREIVERLRDSEHETPSVLSALNDLAGEGYADIGVLSLHVTPGQSYFGLERTVESRNAGFDGRARVRLSPPLVYGEDDASSLASYLISSLPDEIRPDEAVIFAGIGLENAGGLVYPALNWSLFLQGDKGSLHLAVNLDNLESVNQAMRILKLNRRKVVWLIPLMSVNGARASEAVFGTGDKSFASRLKDAGHTVRPHKQGLVANPLVQAMWKSRLKRLMPPPESAASPQ